MAAVLEGNGHHVKLSTLPPSVASLPQIKREIENDQPDIVGVTSTTSTVSEALATVRSAKEVCPSAITVMGGP
ncbi:cobalamin-dependent protein, partial [Candidatus Bathyarchaeota archaeon]|nr:cobalamin-dependent protein [Candidatus Bathyarchaeota archaeon]